MIRRFLKIINENYVKHRFLTSNRGQIAVEYVLLLVVGVSIAALLTSLVVNRDPENPGFLILKWRELIELIGADVIDP